LAGSVAFAVALTVVCQVSRVARCVCLTSFENWSIAYDLFILSKTVPLLVSWVGGMSESLNT